MDVMRNRGIVLVIIAVFAVIVARLFYMQVVDSQYKIYASNNVLRREVLYPARGEVYDRNGEFLVQSMDVYDLMVVPREVVAFDTAMMCSIIGVGVEQMRTELARARSYSSRRPSVIFKQLPKEAKLKLDERNYPGFYTAYRTIRSYPRKIGGNLLGYVREVSQREIDRDDYYRAGDYIGKSGFELAYEGLLRGSKGVRMSLVDAHGIVQGSYGEGMYDTLAVAGTPITSSIDAGLQAFTEELLRGKVGSAVAIEPSTGEVLAMVSSPTYDPDELVGRSSGTNYLTLERNMRRPLFNRAVMSAYPPGSTFKLINGLIGLQEGVLSSSTRYPCNMGYRVGRGVGCHAHYSPLDLPGAVQNSCNAYFCYVFRSIIENRKYGGVKAGLDVWGEYVRSFGFGRKLDSDFLDERNGYVPAAVRYDGDYNGRWNALTVISLAIGQGELGCSPLQMANLAATIANRGYYHVPHVVRQIHDRDSLDARFYERHYTMVDPAHFEPIIEGMYRAVHHDGGTGRRAEVAGLDICGKTGTAQNTRGEDHSTFLCFAPRDNPRIAISVYVENGGGGGGVAAQIASLMIERYLTGGIERTWVVEEVTGRTIRYPAYDR